MKSLLAKEGLGNVQTGPAPGSAIGRAPLSFAQERLWFLGRMQPESAVFHIPAAWRIEGTLEPQALERAVARLTRRHAALRTRLGVEDGRPFQEVLADVTPAFALDPLADVEGGSEERARVALERARADAREPFDLERAPLARFRLYAVGAREHLLAVTIHHVVAEVQSLGILARDLAELYGEELGGAAAELPELTHTFADFARQQRAGDAQGSSAASVAWWQERLSAPLPVLELPTDHQRPAVQRFEGATRSRRVSPELARALREHAARTGRTLFAPLVAAYAALLARSAATRDVLIGIPITDRDQAAFEHVVGFFVNTLVVRCDLQDRPGFEALCERVAEGLLGARAHQDVPFERLVELLAPDRDLSRSPLFQVAFLLQYEAEGGAARLPLGPAAELRSLPPLALHTGTTKFDLALIAFVGDGQLELAFEYDSELFEPETIDRLLARLELLLAAGLADPARPYHELPLVTRDERALLARWNATEAPLEREREIHSFFEQEAARAPERPAVVDGAQTILYGELDRRANRLAHRLRELGVGPDVPVGICTERSVEMVVGILAALKAGGAYLPLDLSYPPDRLAFLLADAGAPVVLTRSAVAELVPAHGGTTLVLDELEPQLAALPDTRPERPLDPLDRLDRGGAARRLAYVIYTSGSTGVPKGVAVEHAGLVNLTTWHRRAYDVRPEDRATHLAGLAFDAAVWELWPYLSAGAALYLVPEDVRLSPARLMDFLARHRITLSFLPTPLCEAVLREPAPRELALRALLTGGDKLRAAPDEPLPYRLVNHYGPTENSVVATCCEVVPGSGESPPIGHPIDNVRVHLYDADGAPVPIGVPGELHIAGDSLARGYHGRPELTAERFVPDPLGVEERLYATGDLARWRELPDGSGTLEFLGRIDGQVKVRGFRIELGEVEARLGGHPAVRECACSLLQRDGDGWLVGYVVEQSPVTDDVLRGFLRESLPDYMCPQAFVRLEALPLTPNGKIDRRALPEPSEEPRAFVRPDGELQTLIAGVWADVLGREEIDAHANFFDVGGHSLLMAQVHARLEERLERTLGIVELFQYPTVASLAAHIEEGRQDGAALADGMDRAASRLARMKRRKSRQVER